MYYRKLLVRFVVAGLALAGTALAQKAPAHRSAYEQYVLKTRTLPAPQSICYKLDRDVFTQILPPETFLKNRQNPRARTSATASFSVTYSNFSPEARTAFQYAVDIWSNLLASPVPIRIQANWTTQSEGVLGSASPAEVRLGSDGTQKGRGIYPIALAEKIARRPLNNPNDPDIVASFNRNNNWYYGLDGKTPQGQTDLVTVVLHEIGHGLGMTGFFNASNNRGEYLVGFPSIYDHFIENNQGQRIVAETGRFPDGSLELYQQLTGENLFLNGPLLQQRSGQRIKIYTPTRYDRGSSIYHVDETTYPAGNPNSLMSPQIGQAEAIHSPGPLVLNIFRDMEWRTTSVLHEPLLDVEDIADLRFTVRIVSDTAVQANTVRLFYRKSAPSGADTTYTSVTPTLVAGTTDTYAYTLPAAQARGEVWYYFQIQDVTGRAYTNPGKAPAGFQLLNVVRVGPDNIPPTILAGPTRNFIFNPAVNDSLQVLADVSDDRQSIDTVYVEYSVNGQIRPAVPLRRTTTLNDVRYDSLYSAKIPFAANTLKDGDVITYRIVARDSSRARNQTISPRTGTYEVRVSSALPTRDSYSTTFQDQATANEFVGAGFSIATPTGFADPAIHSEHPYRNGADFEYRSNYEMVLRTPIRIKANPDSAVMRFDEIVLVEPGEPGSQYGDDDFYDYVIVEGSKDNGRTWLPITTGYDSNDQTDWINAYNRNLVNGANANERNSTTPGTPSLYKRRDGISLTSNGNFRPNDQVLIRFRLFADQLAHGWGWAIDNVQIQVPPPPPVLGVEPVNVGSFAVYPNPVSNGLLRVEAQLTKSFAEAGLTVTGTTGQTVRQQTLKVSGSKISEQLDLTQLPTGLYFVKLQVGETQLTKKIIVTK
ncbi:T9SS C-terminal target domain-containing protein [Fibrisoma montanum]|uniref:T9SS C-terminal target domain-containing protein n=1 Tax=Fibrisoma montanum TaxID=2305895 RepID=A0A418LY74_9BACT|nr:T9SS type A sorting domain-containing protein [Fibrisoma montanum]RIV18280.1 T9SS C-terminal target domain-containing protein [Fibrisoma montanum]